MSIFSRPLCAAALIALVLWPAAFAAADEDDKQAPNVVTQAATAIGEDGATLNASVSGHGGRTTTYHFEYGVTGYEQATTERSLAGSNSARTVTAAISGLLPDTVYHFRVRASNDDGGSSGRDLSFTTTSAGSGSVSTGPDPLGSTNLTPTANVTPPSAASKPVLGDSVVIAPLRGTIKIKVPGAAGYATLAAGDDVPVGTVVDTRHGAIKLTSALGAGKTQSGEFRGALFQVRQASTARGMTDLVLRGANFAVCPRTTPRLGARAAMTASSTSKRPVRRLWSRDKGGRFRTHGRNSVATVRGTSWTTTDTCAGTRTTVQAGAVAVRDRRRGKTFLVRAGHSYLARSAR
jgi:hypothetical protein